MTAAAFRETVSRKLGIIAGQGRLPLLIAATYRSAGRPYFILGIEGIARDDDLSSFEHGWSSLGAVGQTLDLLRANDCNDVVMAGRVARPNFKDLKVDRTGAKLVAKIVAKMRRGDDAVMKLVVKEFEAKGFTVVGIDDVLSELLMEGGGLGRIVPTAEHTDDITYGIDVVQEIGRLDIGQGAVVQHRQVLAVEAMEGTDAMLDRCALISNSQRGQSSSLSGVFVKMPKPGQERRVDLPVIGVKTVKLAAAAGLAGIACAAGGVLVVDRRAVANTADDLGIFVFGFPYDRTAK